MYIILFIILIIFIIYIKNKKQNEYLYKEFFISENDINKTIADKTVNDADELPSLPLPDYNAIQSKMIKY